MINILQILRVAAAVRHGGELTSDDRDQAIEIIDWQREVLQLAEENPEPLRPSVRALSDYLSCHTNDAIARMYASMMIEEFIEGVIEYLGVEPSFTTVEQWLVCINYVIQRAPEYKGQHFPMSKLFVFFMYAPSGATLFRLKEFNVLLTAVLQGWCDYLDSPDSRTVLNPNQDLEASDGWLSLEAQNELCLEQCVNYANKDNPDMPYWGFKSYNDFFHRELDLDTYRPVDSPDDDTVIVSPNDGTVYRIACNVKLCDRFWSKGQEYSLIDMLQGSPYIESFIEGDVLQSFLDGSDYHRWHAPISGTVLEARVIQGLTFSELRSEGFDITAGTLSQGYQAMVNTRGLIVIENPTIGKVAVLPIGITEISSITINVKVGQSLAKGEELGYFSYGGSTLALVFQTGMIKEFIAQEPDQNLVLPSLGKSEGNPNCKTEETCQASDGCLRVRSQIAVAN